MAAAAPAEEPRAQPWWLPTHRRLLAVVAVLAAVTVAGAVWLFEPLPDAGVEGLEADWIQARIDEVTVLGPAAPFFDPDSGEVDVEVVATLEETGETVRFTAFADTAGMYRPGQRVQLAATGDSDPDRPLGIVDVRRERPLLLLTVLFAIAVVVLGRWQGVRALIGLVVTFAVIIGFLVPAVLAGRDPIAVALVGASLILLSTLYLAHGFSAKTTVAIIGTAVALGVTALLAVAFTYATSLTGLVDEDLRFLATVLGGEIDLRGLLLAGIIIGGLGVLDDVTMSQSATVFQVRRAAGPLRFPALFRSGMAVGRDHVAATVNTLFLAYAGAALPLLLLFATAPGSLGPVLSLEIVAIEVIRTLVGSIGLISAVPVTTALAAVLANADPAVVLADPDPDPGHAH